MKCDQCQRDLPEDVFIITAKTSPLIRKRNVCAKCACLNWASHCEHIEPDDTARDISQGEQTGAFFRKFSEKMP